ncbi:CHAT domain-containing protein [Streptomyces sp. WI04-05B]|uniref:Tetratricopeptide domain protein n=2 Tax=Streptomyces turgidiscabies TaxID=85558 RepID=L7F4D3_STRT8|nr:MULTISPECIES: CHAT domain-containing protein [unclassified Streptomyces]ELP65871.1 tetratricopeptide domain protein [Streptomyces turgidiscabies Car8]MDX2548242.1 CHAT domain-containing protein [Streptomyces sp. WI04-05B]MDX2590279.1 CHAT domain-containing protein [Streptomyces sp. WI04-05A]GAQ77348.1 CHAT domain protein [Streptomyces turgidiscabies]
MIFHRPPRTSYGYDPPLRARATGWECRREGCGVSGEPAPRRWPARCPECGEPVDPVFAEPWSKEARIRRWEHDAVHAEREFDRLLSEALLAERAYEDALRAGDADAEDVCADFEAVLKRMEAAGHDTGYMRVSCLFTVILEYADATRAAQELLTWHPLIKTHNVNDDNSQRTAARQFVTGCQMFLKRLDSIGHEHEDDVWDAMRDVAHRAADVMTVMHEQLEREVAEARQQERVQSDFERQQQEGAAPGTPTGEARRRRGIRGWLSPAGRRARADVGANAPQTADAAPQNADIAVRMRTWQAAAHDAIGWPAAERMHVANGWVAWAVATGEPQYAAEAYWHLMSIVPLEAAAGYTSADRERVLKAAQRQTEDAGYWLARARRYRDAVVALETGRAIALSEVTGWERADIATALDRCDRADVALAYRSALDALRAAEQASAAARPNKGEARLRAAWDTLRAARADVVAATGIDPLEPDIRYEAITAAAKDGVLVYIAASDAGGYALIVASKGDPQFMQLPGFDRDSVGTLLLPDAGLVAAGNRTMPDAAILDSLEWLWNQGLRNIFPFYVGGPVVTLIPVGLLSLLPLHAAAARIKVPSGIDGGEWLHPGRLSAIRYAPNARVLRHCDETAHALRGQPPSLLSVNVPETPGQPPLDHVVRETEAITRTWQAGGRSARILPSCTWRQFRDAPGDEQVWHLACHGYALPASIMDSALLFADGPATLQQLQESLHAQPRRLAVLSACQSHVTGSDLPNEVVGMPSALLRLGFAGVIATAWKVDDTATACLMARFHQLWCHDGMEPVVALNRAQDWLAGATCADLAPYLPDGWTAPKNTVRPFADPRYWAAFAYTGV